MRTYLLAVVQQEIRLKTIVAGIYGRKGMSGRLRNRSQLEKLNGKKKISFSSTSDMLGVEPRFASFLSDKRASPMNEGRIFFVEKNSSSRGVGAEGEFCTYYPFTGTNTVSFIFSL